MNCESTSFPSDYSISTEIVYNEYNTTNVKSVEAINPSPPSPNLSPPEIPESAPPPIDPITAEAAALFRVSFPPS